MILLLFTLRYLLTRVCVCVCVCAGVSLCVAMASSSSINVSQLSDAELAIMLRQHGAACGPIICKL